MRNVVTTEFRCDHFHIQVVEDIMDTRVYMVFNDIGYELEPDAFLAMVRMMTNAQDYLEGRWLK